MNDILEFLDGVYKEENIFLEHELEKIIKIFKENSIYEYKVILNKINFKFCNKEYMIIKYNEKDYRIEFRSISFDYTGLSYSRSDDKMIKELIRLLDCERDYLSDINKYPEPMKISANYVIGVDFAEGYPATEWKPDNDVIGCDLLNWEAPENW